MVSRLRRFVRDIYILAVVVYARRPGALVHIARARPSRPLGLALGPHPFPPPPPATKKLKEMAAVAVVHGRSSSAPASIEGDSGILLPASRFYDEESQRISNLIDEELRVSNSMSFCSFC